MANETWWSYYDNMNNTGGGGGGVTVLTQDENGALNKTWAEIKELPFAVLKRESVVGGITTVEPLLLASIAANVEDNPATYSVIFNSLGNDSYIFSTDSPNGYPTYIPDDGGGDVS